MKRFANSFFVRCCAFITPAIKKENIFVIYNVFDSILTILCWIFLKFLSKLIFLFQERTSESERLVIKLGNILFKKPYFDKIYKDYGSYVCNYLPTLDTYLGILTFEKWLVERQILDLGSGLGSYSNLLKKNGARSVVALEYQFSKASFSSKYFSNSFSIINASAEALPFKSKCFDTVFSHTVFEHISDIIATLENILFVLKDNGIIILSYNFFHHRGGHHLFPYIHFPWATWIVSENTLCEYWSERLAFDQAKGKMNFYPKGCRITNLSEGNEINLNKLNFEEFERLIDLSGFKIYRRKTSEPLGLLFPALKKIPKLKYFMTGTVFYVLRKRG